MATVHTLPSIDAVTRHGKDMDIVWTGDLPELVARLDAMQTSRDLNKRDAWCGKKSPNEGKTAMRTGDLSTVPQSDALLNRFEAVRPVSRRFRVRDAISGGAPNVGAFLAGSPLAMRRRERDATETAPLIVVCDLTSSGGIPAAALERRGAAVLALVRMLSSSRPVELWAGCGGSPTVHRNTYVFARVDTAPLDLARAAPLMTLPVIPRGLLYPLICEVGADNEADRKAGYISWNYGSIENQRRNAHDIFARLIPGGTASEIFYVPPPYATDDQVCDDPAAWLETKLAEYGAPAED